MKNEEYILNEELEIDHKMSFLAQPGTAEGFFYLTRPLLLGEAPPLPRPPLLRKGLQPVNRLFCTRKQAVTTKCRGEFLCGAKSRVFEKSCGFPCLKK